MILSILESIHHELCIFHFSYTNILINVLTFGRKKSIKTLLRMYFWWLLEKCRYQNPGYTVVLNPFASDGCAIPVVLNPLASAGCALLLQLVVLYLILNPFASAECLSIPSPWPVLPDVTLSCYQCLKNCRFSDYSCLGLTARVHCLKIIKYLQLFFLLVPKKC